MAASSSDKLARASNGGIPAVATVQANRSTGITTLSVDTQQFWPTLTGIKFSTYKVDTTGKKITGSQTDWEGVSNGTNQLSNIIRTGGATDSGNAIGDKVQMGPTAQWADDVVTNVLTQHNQDGTHSAVTATSITTTGNITVGGLFTMSSNSKTVDANGWTVLNYGAWKEYVKHLSWTGSQTLTATSIVDITFTSNTLPVGLADLTGAFVTMSQGTTSDRACHVYVEVYPASTVIGGHLYNPYGGTLTITSADAWVRIVK